MQQVHQALMGEWLGRINKESQSFWKHIVEEKYGASRDAREIQDANYRCLGFVERHFINERGIGKQDIGKGKARRSVSGWISGLEKIS